MGKDKTILWIIGTIVLIVIIMTGGLIIFLNQNGLEVESTTISGYRNFQVNGQESIIYSRQIDNTNIGFINTHFLEDNGKQMCSTCDFSNADTEWTTAIGFLKGDWSSTRFRSCIGECESFDTAAGTMRCEVAGSINLLCDKEPVTAERCTSTNHPYSFTGSVSYSQGNGFVCSIPGAKEQLLQELPETFIRPDGETRSPAFLGFEGTVTFTRVIPECSNGEERCVGQELQKCEGVLWGTGENVLGKCGIGCITKTDCAADEILGESCSGNNIVENTKVSSCLINVCSPSTETIIKQTCEFGCEDVSGSPQCSEEKIGDKLNTPLIIIIAIVMILIVVAGIFLISRRK